MFCKKCGKAIPDDSRYCLYCGTDNAMENSDDAEKKREIGKIPSIGSISNKIESRKGKNKTGLILLLMATLGIVIGLIVYLSIERTKTEANAANKIEQVFIYDSSAVKESDDEAINTIREVYKDLYIYKDGYGYVTYNPVTRTERRLGGEVAGVKEEVWQNGNYVFISLFSVKSGELFLVIPYVELPDAFSQKVIAEIEEKSA